MDKQRYSGVLISDFNVANLAAYLRNDCEFPSVDVSVAPFGQPLQVLLQKDLECWQGNPDFALVWTQPEGVIESFKQLLSYKQPPLETILGEVDDFSALLLDTLDRVKLLFVTAWALPPCYRGFGMLDLRSGMGAANTLMHINLRLAQNLEKAPNVCLLNSQRWLSVAGKHAFNPKLWYMAKIPFGNEVFTEAVNDLKCALSGLNGMAKKLIVLDLDDTLWGGIVGDVGWENLRLGGHDFLGEAYLDFQRELKALTHRGILLGIVSKNEEAIALEAITKHPKWSFGWTTSPAGKSIGKIKREISLTWLRI